MLFNFGIVDVAFIGKKNFCACARIFFLTDLYSISNNYIDPHTNFYNLNGFILLHDVPTFIFIFI